LRLLGVDLDAENLEQAVNGVTQRHVALLVIAGADVDLIVECVDRARRRSKNGYSRR
jgi:hypothetical protein